MSKSSKGLDINILGREFRVACSEQEEPALLKAVQYVDTKMRAVRDQGKVVGVERIAIMVALNMAHEMFNSRTDGSFDMVHLEGRISDIQNLIEQAMAGQDELF
jgi:cell division protein ZapA